MSILLEVVCYSVEDAYRAKAGGAQRVELCSDPGSGGTTPSYGLIKQSVALGGVQVAVMIRPRGGDFLYTPPEIEVMKDDIRVAAALGASTVVFGVLDENWFLDELVMSGLVQLSKSLGLEVTCHRAFDLTLDPLRSFQALLDLGVDRLLTSGQQRTAPEGLPLLQKLIALSRGRLSVMPGGGIRPGNVRQLLQLDLQEIHTGSRLQVPSKMKKAEHKAEMGPADSQSFQTFVDEEAVRQIVNILQSA